MSEGPDFGQLPPPRAQLRLLGQEAAEAHLAGLLAAGRLPHALVLAGPPGIGKATLAFRLARRLFARIGTHEASLAIPDGNGVIARVASGGHPDLLTIEPGWDEDRQRQRRDLPVDQVRRIAPFLQKKAGEGGWRVVIVDGAESLNRNGQNALLKVLEEPPPQAILMLVTARAGALLPTIRSRTQTVTLEPLPGPIVAQLLAEAHPDLDAAQAAATAALAGGSIGRALELVEGEGVTLAATLQKLLGEAPALDLIAAHGFADKMGRREADLSWRLMGDLLLGLTRALARAAATGEAARIGWPDGERFTGRLLATATTAQWLRAGDEAQRLITMTDEASLDRRQATLTLLQLVANPAAVLARASTPLG